MNEVDEVKDKIKEIILQTFDLNIPPEEIDDEMMITNGGLFLNSAAVISLIVRIEKEFGIRFDDTDLELESNNSIYSLAGYIHKKIKNSEDKSGK